MTALCPTCETCAHCAKHGCIPVSGEAPVAAHRVVCDGRGIDPRYATADALLQCAHAFWKSERDAGQPGAVKWLTGDDGSLVIFTRGEYREVLLRAVDDVGCQEHFFASAPPDAAPSPIPVVSSEAARELVSNYRKAVIEWWQTRTEDDHQRMVSEQVALCAALAPIPVVEAASDGSWNPMESIPKEPGRYLRVRTSNVYRWLPYKPASNEFKRGIKGRWQLHDGYGFTNADLVGDAWKDAVEAPK